MNHVFNAKCDTFEIHPLKYCNVYLSYLWEFFVQIEY